MDDILDPADLRGVSITADKSVGDAEKRGVPEEFEGMVCVGMVWIVEDPVLVSQRQVRRAAILSPWMQRIDVTACLHYVAFPITRNFSSICMTDELILVNGSPEKDVKNRKKHTMMGSINGYQNLILNGQQICETLRTAADDTSEAFLSITSDCKRNTRNSSQSKMNSALGKATQKCVGSSYTKPKSFLENEKESYPQFSYELQLTTTVSSLLVC